MTETASPEVVTEPAETTGSLADYEAAVHQPAVEGTAPTVVEAETDEDEPPAAEPEKPAGRHRAKSQQANADDIVSIAALAKRVAEVEEREGKDIVQHEGESNRVFKLRRRAELAERREQATKTPTRPTSVPRETARPPVETRAAETPEKPKAEDVGTTYATYEEFVEKLAEWTSDRRDEARTAERVKQNREASAKTEGDRLIAAFESRKPAARAKYADFDAVALLTDTRIPAGSVPDLFIFEDEAGLDVLYHLQRHPDELDALLTKPALQQVKVLSLLAQRLTTQAAADSTGAAPRTTSQPAPRPPTPVKGGPSRPADEPPTADDTPLSEHEKAFHKARR